MADLLIQLHSQQSPHDAPRFQSHQWAAIPDELSVDYMTGGLKRVRRLVETYCRYRFSAQASKWVRASWRRGEPLFRLRFLRLPLLTLGRLRQTGTVDAYRGFMDVLGGDMIAPDAITAPAPWPDDLPWVAPSAGEFDIEAEHQRPPYLGIFEFRVCREAAGCSLHLFLRDLPPVRTGVRARLWQQPWQPLTRAANLAFLRAEAESTAHRNGHAVRFAIEDHPGVPEPLPALRQQVGTANAS